MPKTLKNIMSSCIMASGLIFEGELKLVEGVCRGKGELYSEGMSLITGVSCNRSGEIDC